MYKHLFFLIIIILSFSSLVGCSLTQQEDPTPTFVVRPTQTASPTGLPQATLTTVPSPTAVINSTNTPSPTTMIMPSSTPAKATPVVNIPTTPNAETVGQNVALQLQPSDQAQSLSNLPEGTALNIFGRTENASWFSVLTEAGDGGWIKAQFVDLYVDMSTIAVLDVPENIEIAQANEAAEAIDPATVDDTMIPFSEFGRVDAEGNGLNLRGKPSTSAEIVGVVAEDAVVQIKGKNENETWYFIQTPQRLEGWVFGQYIRVGDVETFTIPLESSDNEGDGIGEGLEVNPPSITLAAGGAVTGISSNAGQIFLTGQQMGNRSNVFSKVGDSITATGHFLYPFGWGRYELGQFSQYQSVIGFFGTETARESNSFSNGSLAAKPYWNTATILDPANALIPPCNPGELPLVCEYRVVRPSVSLIMMGTNDIGARSAAEYQANLEIIVGITMDMGVIPILSTLPPKIGWEGEVARFNQIIIATARAYDVPLWDYYTTMIQLPNQGLNEDGVHPSYRGSSYEDYDYSGNFTGDNLTFGFTMRNLMALQVLDAVWKQIIAVNPYSGSVLGNNTSRLNLDKYFGEEEETTDSAQDTTPQNTLPNTQNTQPEEAVSTGDPNCSGAPLPRLTLGGLGRVTPGASNNFRTEPNLNAAKLGGIPGGAMFSVLAGPTCNSGLNYWQVNYNGKVGWTAEGKGETYWLEPQ